MKCKPTLPPEILRVLIPFNTSSFLYGMERAVIETFELLQPDIEPLFIVSQNPGGADYPVQTELARHQLTTARFSDTTEWGRFEKPKSIAHFLNLLLMFLRGNRDVFRHALSQDALYLPGVMYGYFSFLTMLFYKLQGKRIVHQFHEFLMRSNWQIKWLNHFVTDHIHATEFGFRTVAAMNPSILKRRNHIIPIPVTLPECPDSNDMLEAFGQYRNIVYAGQLSRQKGLDLLLEAFRQLRQRYPEIRLHLLGTPDPLEEDIKYWGFREDVPAFLRHAFVVVQATPPSRMSESFGRTVVEAAMAGVPVVCFGGGALSSLVKDGVTGTICAEETADSMAEAIAGYLDDSTLRDRHAANARNYAAVICNPKTIREAWLRCFGR